MANAGRCAESGRELTEETIFEVNKSNRKVNRADEQVAALDLDLIGNPINNKKNTENQKKKVKYLSFDCNATGLSHRTPSFQFQLSSDGGKSMREAHNDEDCLDVANDNTHVNSSSQNLLNAPAKYVIAV